MSSHEVSVEKLPLVPGYKILIDGEEVGSIVFLQHRRKPFLEVVPGFFEEIRISGEFVMEKAALESQSPTEKQVAYALVLAKQRGQEISEAELRKMTRKAVSELIDKLREAGKKEAG